MIRELLLAWLRPACAFFGVAGILVLAGCGGGSGAPNNPYEPPPPAIMALELIPGSATIYPGTPFTVTVSGGVPPYRLFTTNATIVPVPTTLAGDTFVVVAANVGAATVVNVGVQDARGVVGRDIILTVQPSALLPASVEINGNPSPTCNTTVSTVCSGGTGTANVKLTGAGGLGLSGRPVRYDVVQGNFQIVSTNPAQPLVQTLTTTSDTNGNASVVLSVPPDTPTQTGILRVTDVTTGQQITGTFSILQVTTEGEVLSVLPTGTVTITGPDSTHCSSGVQVDYFIYGGTPPYQVVVNFPQAITISGAPVNKNGGKYTLTTNGTCFTNLTAVITDATGRAVQAPGMNNNLGTGAPVPPVGPFTVTPGAISKSACVPANTFQFIGTGGTAPYSAVVLSSTSPTSAAVAPQTGIAQGQAVSVSGLTSPSTTVVQLLDNSSPRQSANVTIDCTGGPPPPTPSPLVVTPVTAGSATISCPGQQYVFAITGGTPPYNVFFQNPKAGAAITPSTVAGSGQTFTVTNLPNGVPTTNSITISDSGSPANVTVASVVCPP